MEKITPCGQIIITSPHSPQTRIYLVLYEGRLWAHQAKMKRVNPEGLYRVNLKSLVKLPGKAPRRKQRWYFNKATADEINPLGMLTMPEIGMLAAKIQARLMKIKNPFRSSAPDFKKGDRVIYTVNSALKTAVTVRCSPFQAEDGGWYVLVSSIRYPIRCELLSRSNA